MRIGVISDTHGLLRPEALVALAGVDHILHGGDIGREDIVTALEEIAPVTAIRAMSIPRRGAGDFPKRATSNWAGCGSTCGMTASRSISIPPRGASTW